MQVIELIKPYLEQWLPGLLICLVTLLFVILERKYPGRELPQSTGWYFRSVSINVAQILLIGLGGITWNKYFRTQSIFHFGDWSYPVVEGLAYWFVGAFVFYWWHRLRHANGFWLIFHQVHHSPKRIEVLTSFYKHPIEIIADSLLTGFLIYYVLGGTAVAGAWTSFFGAAGEYFYHSNISTPKWVGYFLQRPEHHSIHHQLDVHKYNFGDITLWDRMFGTFKEAEDFAPDCGFPNNNETKMWEMFKFKDVYNS